MAAYRIEFKASAVKELAKLPRARQRLIVKAIDALADEPRPPGAEKLKGKGNAYRIRSGDYRVVYEVYDDVLIVHIIRIAHRRDVYRQL